MKNTILFCSAAGIMILTGCQPRLAQVDYSSEEAGWQKTISKNYSGYRAPRTQPPAVIDHTSEKLATVAEPGPVAETPPAEENPEKEPAAVEETAPADEQQPQAEAEAAAPAPAPAPVPVADGAAAKPVVTEPPEPTNSQVHVVKAGETLSGLAKKYYGDSRRQDVIVRANADLVRNPNKLYPGMKLIIPKF